MWNEERDNRHAKNVQNETGNPAIVDDVIDSGLEHYPSHNEKLPKGSPLAPMQEIVRNNTDGKTWQNFDE